MPKQTIHSLNPTLLLLTLLLTPLSANAASDASIPSMLIHLSESYPALIRLISAMSYVAGAALAMVSLYHFKQYGDKRTMDAKPSSLKYPAGFLIAAGGLLYAPSLYSTVMETLFGDPEFATLSYSQQSTEQEMMIKGAIGLAQVLGTLSFMRGIFLLSSSATPYSRTRFMKPLAYIVGGALAINTPAMVGALAATAELLTG